MLCPRCGSPDYRIVHRDSVPYCRCKKCGKNYKATSEAGERSQIQKDLAETRLKQKLVDAEAKYKSALNYIKQVEAERDAALSISYSPQIGAIPLHGSQKGDAVCLAIWSDWHWGERVDLEATNGLNEYNPEIASARANKIYQNTLKLIQKERHSSTINHLVIGILGDMITGILHEEQGSPGGNYLSPIEEVSAVQNSLATGIQFLLDNGGLEKITIVCIGGNHGRLTDRMYSSTGHKYSLENLMYWNLKRQMQDPRIEWIIPQSNICYVKVFEKTLRFFHGWEVNFNGGVGGIMIPMIKFILRQNENIRADYSFCGHFHTLLHNDSNRFAINGSLIGASPWSLSKGFPAERPCQLFRVLDKQHGFTGSYPILC